MPCNVASQTLPGGPLVPIDWFRKLRPLVTKQCIGVEKKGHLRILLPRVKTKSYQMGFNFSPLSAKVWGGTLLKPISNVWLNLLCPLSLTWSTKRGLKVFWDCHWFINVHGTFIKSGEKLSVFKVWLSWTEDRGSPFENSLARFCWWVIACFPLWWIFLLKNGKLFPVIGALPIISVLRWGTENRTENCLETGKAEMKQNPGHGIKEIWRKSKQSNREQTWSYYDFTLLSLSE